MSKRALLSLLLAGLPAVVLASAPAPSSRPDYSKYSEESLKSELKESATDERAVLVPMRDGVGLATNVFRPKDAKGALPTILWKTPYSELGMRGPSLRYALAAVKQGYAFVIQNERGRYFSEGKYRNPGLSANRRLRRAELDREAALVERQGRHARLLLLRRVAARAGGAEPSRACRDGAHVRGRRHRQGRPIPGTRQLVHRRRASQPVLRVAVSRRQSTARAAARRARSRRSARASLSTTIWTRRSPTWCGPSRSNICRSTRC